MEIGILGGGVTIHCSFDIGNIVTIKNYNRIYYADWVKNHSFLRKKCPKQFYRNYPIQYPKEWKIIDALVCSCKDDGLVELAILLRARTKEELLIEAFVYKNSTFEYTVENKDGLPFTVVNRDRKVKTYLETKINYY